MQNRISIDISGFQSFAVILICAGFTRIIQGLGHVVGDALGILAKSVPTCERIRSWGPLVGPPPSLRIGFDVV